MFYRIVDCRRTTDNAQKHTHAFCSGKGGGEGRLCRTKIDTFSYRVSVIFSPFCDTTVFTPTRVIKQQGGCHGDVQTHLPDIIPEKSSTEGNRERERERAPVELMALGLLPLIRNLISKSLFIYIGNVPEGR